MKSRGLLQALRAIAMTRVMFAMS